MDRPSGMGGQKPHHNRPLTTSSIAMVLAISMTTMRVNMQTMMAMAANILVTMPLEVLQEVEITPLMEE